MAVNSIKAYYILCHFLSVHASWFLRGIYMSPYRLLWIAVTIESCNVVNGSLSARESSFLFNCSFICNLTLDTNANSIVAMSLSADSTLAICLCLLSTTRHNKMQKQEVKPMQNVLFNCWNWFEPLKYLGSISAEKMT